MAEPVGASPRPAVAGDPDEVLATKLYVPPRQEGFIPRARLVERLNEGLTRALTLVCAPVGFGKTALLADWGRESHAGSRGSLSMPATATQRASGATQSRHWTASGPAYTRSSPRR
jgi:hypothetical protein